MTDRIIDQADPEWGSVEVACGDRCVSLQIHDTGKPRSLTYGAVLTPDGARDLARALERMADNADEVE